MDEGKVVETGRASKIMTFRGLERVPTEEANAGDIISLAGLTVATVAWLGYRAPSSLARAVSTRYADAGGPSLDRTLDPPPQLRLWRSSPDSYG